MLLRWLLPSGLRWLLHSGTPLSNSHWFLHIGRGLLLFSNRWFLSSKRWLLHSRRGMLLSSSRWFLPSSLGRFHPRMFHHWFLLGGMLLQRTRPVIVHALDHYLLLPFPVILSLGVASLRLQLVVRIFNWIFFSPEV
ncbi:hypothetical protein B296_00024996 [Ensete ventricosum]|uniref:Uncharacterized protein n=1 Tax=Ensete ventricosum TaxID=4639 RepID=A0A426Y4Z2_ENSVE|nr:hypothetical protein B296_00024996 [Ensete ventricosum]